MWPIPPMPGDSRRTLDVLPEVDGPLGIALWRSLSDVLLWVSAPPEARGELFHPYTPQAYDPTPEGVARAPEIADALGVLRSVYLAADRVQAADVAEACGAVTEWAEPRGHREVALQFAEAAARLEPETSRRAFVAGRLCRRAGAYDRAFLWYDRAIRLARRAHTAGVPGAEIDFANAHLGFGNTLIDLGFPERAEPHFWKALRAARREGVASLTGAGFHSLLVVASHLEQWEDAIRYASKAMALYSPSHPRFPNLAFDLAFTLARAGRHAEALPMLEKVLPHMDHTRDRIGVLAAIAESAGALGNRLRYDQAAAEVERMAAEDSEMSASSLYLIAEGAHHLQEWDRAESLASQALDVAVVRRNKSIMRLAPALLRSIAERASD